MRVIEYYMWLGNLKNLFDKLKTLGEAADRSKSDMGKSYEGLYDIAETLSLLYDMRKKHNKHIIHCVVMKLNNDGESVKRLGIELPRWLRTLCCDVIMYHVGAKWKVGNYRAAFCTVDIDLLRCFLPQSDANAPPSLI